MNIVIAARRGDYSRFATQLADAGVTAHIVQSPAELTLRTLSEISPRYVFFPHWSEYIPKELFEAFECIIFHMTDVPFGRGGSPLQNLIVRGFSETRVTALKCVSKMDAGPVYLKASLSLGGTAEEIYLRAAGIIEQMMQTIIATAPTPVPQHGEPVLFDRRTSEQGNLKDLENLEQVFDFIRMLDAEGYPHAFLACQNLHFEFTKAKLSDSEVTANVRITRR